MAKFGAFHTMVHKKTLSELACPGAMGGADGVLGRDWQLRA
jgi:hypothetical protein